MEIVNIHNAKTHLSQLLAQVEQGEQIIIAKADKPIAVLSPYQEKKQKLAFGSMKGKIKMSKDFDKLPAWFMKYFE